MRIQFAFWNLGGRNIFIKFLYILLKNFPFFVQKKIKAWTVFRKSIYWWVGWNLFRLEEVSRSDSEGTQPYRKFFNIGEGFDEYEVLEI